MIGDTITLIHRGTNERKALPVEFVCRTYLSIRWPMAGIYDLNLRDNVLTARSHAARRKGGNQIKWWYAEDILAVRHMVTVHLDGEDRKAETKRLMTDHERKKYDEAVSMGWVPPKPLSSSK